MSLHGQAWSGFLDRSRAIDWSSAGFVIPKYTDNCATQPTLLAGSGNASANATAIQNALKSCDATHNVVNLPAGTYYVTGITFGSQGHQVLRGAGASAPGNSCAAGSTCLILTATTGCTGLPAGICMNGSVTYAAGAWVLPPSGEQQCSWTAGYAQGTTSITLNSCGSSSPMSNSYPFIPLAAGQLLILDQSNDLTDNGGLYLCDSYTSSQSGGGACTINDGSPGAPEGRQIGGYTYSQKQVTVIQSVSGSGTGPYTVVISPGVYFNNIRSDRTPGAWWVGTLANEGLENIYIDGSAIPYFNVEIAGCYDCWVKGVASYNAPRAHVKTIYDFGTVIRDNYFFQSQSHASESYGWELDQTSGELAENNIFQQVTNPLMSINTSGSVFGYNLAVGSVYANTSYLIASFASHDAGNDMNLLEGNSILGFATDAIWGSSNTETYFRNFLTGWQRNFAIITSFTGTSGTLTFTTANQSVYASTVTLYGFTGANTGLNGQTVTVLNPGNYPSSFQATVTGSGYSNGSGYAAVPAYLTTQSFVDRSFSRAHNLIGNVLGQPSYHDTYESYATSTSGGVNTNKLSTSIYSLGWTGAGETTSGTCTLAPNCDSVVRPTLMRWGNYDTVTAGVKWDSTEASPAAVAYVNANFSSGYFGSLAHTLPASLYYSSQPSWWPSGKAWPPIGPDVATGNLGTCSGTYSGAQGTSSSQCTGGTLTGAWAAHANSIPAQDCYLKLMGGPPDGSGSMLTFDANACYYIPLQPPTNFRVVK